MEIKKELDFTAQSSGELIRHLRYLACLSQNELGHKLGISKAAISFYECGTRIPTWKQINKFIGFAKELGYELTAYDFALPERMIKKEVR